MRLIIIVAPVISGFVTISLIFFQATRKTYPGFGRWIAGVAFLTLGYSALAVRGFVPDALSIFVVNLAFPVGMVLHLDGLRRFLGSGSMPKLWYAICALDLVATAILYYGHYSASWRSVVLGIAVSVPHLAMADLIFRHPVKHKSIFYPVIGALLCLAGLVVLVTAISAVFMGQLHPLTDSPFQLSFFVILILLQIGEGITWMMLNGVRVEWELLETEADLRQTVGRLQQSLAEQKKTEEALRGSEERFKQVTENAGEWIWEVDANGVFQYCSSTVEKILGYSPNELVGHKRFYDLFAPDVRESSKQAALEVFEAGRNFRAFVGTNIHKNGRIVVLQTSGSPLFDEQGTFIGYHGTSIDITERKQADEALRESERRYRSLFENMLEGFAYCKMIFEDGKPQDFVYLSVNDSFERLTGLKNVVGHKVTEAIPSVRESNPELLEIYGRVVLTGKPEQFETCIKSLGLWLSIAVYSLEKQHFVAVFDNITERKQAEWQLQLEKDRLKSILGHMNDGVCIVSPQHEMEYPYNATYDSWQR
ncbi:MAG: PAS domain-containing protein [Desulfomonilaceae bacterium]